MAEYDHEIGLDPAPKWGIKDLIGEKRWKNSRHNRVFELTPYSVFADQDQVPDEETRKATQSAIIRRLLNRKRY